MNNIEKLKPCLEKINWHCKPRKKAESLITWVAVFHEEYVHLYHWEKDGELHMLKPGCDCAINHHSLEHIGHYLEAALVTGKFHRLIVAGSKDDLKEIHTVLSPMLIERIEAEVPVQDFMKANPKMLKELIDKELGYKENTYVSD